MKRKVWNITVKDNPNRAAMVMGDNDEFYTTDTEAYLVFKLEDKNFNPATAVLTLENRNDGSLKNETVDVVDGLIEWEMPQRYIEHFGNWQGQLVYEDTKDGQPELYTSAPFSFVVNAHIGDKKKPSLVEIENWEKFIREGTELIETWEDMEDLRQANEAQRQANYQELLDTGVLQTNINTKLEALEEEYAPKLTEVTAQLAQTQKDFDTAVNGITVDSELKLSRNSATKSKEFTTLGLRLEEIETDIEEDVVVSATNLITNPMSDWATRSATINTIDSDTLRVTGESSSGTFQFWKNSNYVLGNKYYMSVLLKNVSNVTEAQIKPYPEAGVIATITPLISQFTRVSGIYDANQNLTRTLYLILAHTGNGVVDFKKPMFLDLTTIFGAGNEPTVTQMDRLLEQFPDSWFDGTVNVYNSKHMMAMFFKELTKLNNAITTLGGNV